MASDEMMTFQSSLQDEDFDDDTDDGFDHHQHPHNLSRLSVCTSSTLCGVDDDVDNLASMCMSRLSIESFEGDGDADGELSDGNGKEETLLPAGLSSGSENESGSCYSLPATPPRRRNRVGVIKDYASDNEARKGTKNSDKYPAERRRRRSRRVRRDRWEVDRWENSSDQRKKSMEEEEEEIEEHVMSGESDQSGGGGSGSTGTGVMVITRPKGGKRTLCMDLEEVKACRDLGFELEHERMLEIPSHLSFSNPTLGTSSGSNSPIANWRISGPGDDPRDVKARLKVWAQAVALASASKYGS